MLIGCLGGWCQSREKCAHHEIFPVDRFVERLCGKEEEPTVIKEYEDKPVCGKEPQAALCETVTG
jgi:hypothetical protein